MKRLAALLIMLSLVAFSGGIICADDAVDYTIDLSAVTVNGNAISNDTKALVYVTRVAETHDEAPDNLKSVENTVINITGAGKHRITGSIDNGRIVVDAGNNDSVTLVLDNATINCQTAPAILIKNAYDPQAAGKSGVIIELAGNSTNNIVGSDGEDNSGAISSDVSVTIEGSGTLNIKSGNEGIETKMHLTVNGGNLYINSSDDAINGNEDGVSHIMINGGFVYASASLGSEGDAIDSNGYLTINGGTVVALAHPTSQDGALDADLGVFINGGTVVGIGNMMSEITDKSSQQYIQLVFASRQAKDTLIMIADAAGNAAAAFKAPQTFTSAAFSTADLKNGTYYVYINGDITGTVNNGLYTNITSYKSGVRQQHSGNFAEMGFGMGRPQGNIRPEGMEPPVGQWSMPVPPERGTRPEGMGTPPEGMTRPDGMPEGIERPGWTAEAKGESAAGSIEFTLSSTEKTFRGVRAAADAAETVINESASNFDEIRVLLKNEYLSFDVAPVIENGRALVPLRVVFEALGMEVEYNNGEIIAAKEGLTIKTTVGSKLVYKNGEEITLDVGSKIVNDRTLVPVRFVAESAGLKVEYNESTKTVIIN